eukprot:gnl/TRDRNA2_/TRDRNA2_172760_c0_seq1.p1 gnl/TRDRNA2_/TRDRNA2_172760_c0~~gnl/TRDRNA2_/TRDRNA2_172760_c0_seq1.p1  ORF type:complete len:261 (-),score=55.16 gnl/TRDRNA2_/TRDRNA2_172760_c0_seq1:81-746(-)
MQGAGACCNAEEEDVATLKRKLEMAQAQLREAHGEIQEAKGHIQILEHQQQQQQRAAATSPNLAAGGHGVRWSSSADSLRSTSVPTPGMPMLATPCHSVSALATMSMGPTSPPPSARATQPTPPAPTARSVTPVPQAQHPGFANQECGKAWMAPSHHAQSSPCIVAPPSGTCISAPPQRSVCVRSMATLARGQVQKTCQVAHSNGPVRYVSPRQCTPPAAG